MVVSFGVGFGGVVGRAFGEGLWDGFEVDVKREEGVRRRVQKFGFVEVSVELTQRSSDVRIPTTPMDSGMSDDFKTMI